MATPLTCKRVMVTGGAGYVGSVLVPKLLAAGHEVVVLDLYLYGTAPLAAVRNHPGLTEVKGDLRDRALLGRILPGCDAVIHLACISNDPSFELDPELGKSINYEGASGPCDFRDSGDIVKTHDRTLLRHAQAGPREGADRAERGHVVECHQRGEGTLRFQHLLREFISGLEAGSRVAGFGEIDGQAGVDFEPAGFGKSLNAFPARSAVR